VSPKTKLQLTVDRTLAMQALIQGALVERGLRIPHPDAHSHNHNN
jgi:hypothetical protein